MGVLDAEEVGQLAVVLAVVDDEVGALAGFERSHLATDFNPGSSPTPSMTMILSLASTHMRVTPAEGLTAATVNAAYSLNRGGEAGTLEPGKRADFVAHDCADYRELAYFFGVEHAHATYVGGRPAFAR